MNIHYFYFCLLQQYTWINRQSFMQRTWIWTDRTRSFLNAQQGNRKSVTQNMKGHWCVSTLRHQDKHWNRCHMLKIVITSRKEHVTIMWPSCDHYLVTGYDLFWAWITYWSKRSRKHVSQIITWHGSQIVTWILCEKYLKNLLYRRLGELK